MRGSDDSLTARGESPAAFGWRCIPADSVAPRSNISDILTRRALSSGCITSLSATLDFHHGLLGHGRRRRLGRVVRTIGSLDRLTNVRQRGARFVHGHRVTRDVEANGSTHAVGLPTSLSLPRHGWPRSNRGCRRARNSRSRRSRAHTRAPRDGWPRRHRRIGSPRAAAASETAPSAAAGDRSTPRWRPGLAPGRATLLGAAP